MTHSQCLLLALLVVGVGAGELERRENRTLWLERVERVTPWWPTTRSASNRTRIIFVKTHKTAGSTISSILHRYCAEHSAEIRCFVPSGVGGVVTRPGLTPTSLHRYNPDTVEVHAQHTSYWPVFLHTLVPEPAPIITVIRNPVSRFLSTWDYRQFHWKGQTDILRIVKSLPLELQDVPRDFLPLIDHDSAHLELCPKNPPWAISNASEPSCIQTLRDVVQGKLELVLLTERLDEGLVLLARSMGWPLSSVVYSSMKVSSQHKVHSKPPPEVAHKIESWLEEDKLLYEVAGALLDRRIESQDASFWSDLKEFRRLKERAHLDCLGRSHHPTFNADSCAHLRQDNVEWVAAEHRRIEHS